MDEHKHDQKATPEAGWPAKGGTHGGTLPEDSPTAGEAALEKGDLEWGPRAGKGGDHPTPGAGEHDTPQN